MKVILLTKKKENKIKDIIAEVKERSLHTKYLKHGVSIEIDGLIWRIEKILFNTYNGKEQVEK